MGSPVTEYCKTCQGTTEISLERWCERKTQTKLYEMFVFILGADPDFT